MIYDKQKNLSKWVSGMLSVFVSEITSEWWLSEWMSEWVSEITSEWWLSEWMSEWVREITSEWWFSESMNEWVREITSEWWVSELVSDWLIEWVSDCRTNTIITIICYFSFHRTFYATEVRLETMHCRTFCAPSAHCPDVPHLHVQEYVQVLLIAKMYPTYMYKNMSRYSWTLPRLFDQLKTYFIRSRAFTNWIISPKRSIVLKFVRNMFWVTVDYEYHCILCTHLRWLSEDWQTTRENLTNTELETDGADNYYVNWTI